MSGKMTEETIRGNPGLIRCKDRSHTQRVLPEYSFYVPWSGVDEDLYNHRPALTSRARCFCSYDLTGAIVAKAARWGQKMKEHLAKLAGKPNPSELAESSKKEDCEDGNA